MDCFGTCFTHAQTCDNVPVQSAAQWTASAHALHMPKPVITFLFKVLRNGLLRHMLYTCPNCDNVPVQSATQWTASAHALTHAQTCDNVPVQSATQWTASAHALHMPKPVITFLFKLCYAMDCFGACFTHAQTCENVPVQSAAQWTASAHA